MDDLNEYLEYFKTLSIEEKKEIVLDELKVLTSLTNKMCNEIGASNEVLLNKEVLKTTSEDDYNEALITYICSIKNSLSDFNIKLTEISDNLE